MIPMKYLVVCTFELKGACTDADYETACRALRVLDLREASADNSEGRELPEHTFVGSYDSPNVAFLRNCLQFKLREIFQRHGLDAEFLLVISLGELAWAREGFRPGDFAARHGLGAFRDLESSRSVAHARTR
jgi:hypothetical protein